MSKKVNINPGDKICVRWDILPSNYSKNEEDDIRHMMAAKYGIPVKNVSVEVNWLNNNSESGIALNTENISNIKDPKFQQELFKQYIEDNKIECDFDEIIKIDSKINALINYDSYENGKRYSIKWIKWSNFLSYGENNFFDFTTLKGVVLLSGKPANESGKSTFAYDLLHFLLFGNKTNSEKAKTLEGIFNNYRPEATKVEVEGCICIEGRDYIIRRVLTRTELGKKTRTVNQKVSYYEVNENGFKSELVDKNVTEDSNKKTSKSILDAIGTEDDFNMIISANAKDLDSLISMKETERGRLLSRWIGLSVLEDKDSKAREMWNKDVSKNRYCSIYNREEQLQQIEQIKKYNEQEKSFIESEEKRKKQSEDEYEKQTKRKNEFISKKKPIDESLSKIDIHTIEERIKTITSNGISIKQQKEAKELELKGLDNVIVNEEEYKHTVSQKERIISELATYRAQIVGLKTQNNQLLNAEYCPTCHRKLENVDNSGLISKNNDEISRITSVGVSKSEEKKKLEEKISLLETQRKVQHERSTVELKIAALESQLIISRNEYKEQIAILSSFNANKDAIAENNKIDAEINIIDASIKASLDSINNATYNIACSNKNIETNNGVIKEKNAIIFKINEEEKSERNWKAYLKMIGKDGISKIVLKNSLPILNGEVNRLLSGVADFGIEIEVNDKNDIDFWLIRDDIKTRLSGASGLERTQAALALRVVLGKMSNLSRPPFLLLDEILGTVAKENYDKMRDLYMKISKEYEFILHITHLTDIADWHTSNVVVIKENNISKII